MNSPAGQGEPRLYLGKVSVLLVEGNVQEQEIVAQILSGFKVKAISKRKNAAAAMEYLERDCADLVIIGAALPDMDGYDLVRWLRTSRNPGQKSPVLLLSAHTRASDVVRARDCGASWVLVKPVTPQVLFKRIAWLAEDERPFVETSAYSGPDRRSRNLGPPPGTSGRRKDDLSLKVGNATEDNMSQSEIDALMNPRRVA